MGKASTTLLKGLDRAQAYLAARQSADGGWGYAAGRQSYAEPTCYALLALAAGADSASRAERESRALGWFTRRSQVGAIVHEDRAQRAVASDHLDTWGTILSFFALRSLRLGGELTEKYLRYLLHARGNPIDRAASEMLKLDGDLVAWSWAQGTASWVEPTAYAVLALKSQGLGAHERVKAGETYLLDRACYDGGWNYGNKEVLAVKLEAMPTVTAYALLALQDYDRQHPVIVKSLDYLERELAAHQSTLALALGALCLKAYGQPVESLAVKLAARQEEDGSWRGNLHLTALASLALQAAATNRNVFKLA